MRKTFLIEYAISFDTGTTLRKKMRVYNCSDELHAKVKLGDYIKRKENHMVGFEITNCELDLDVAFDFLGVNNPFK